MTEIDFSNLKFMQKQITVQVTGELHKFFPRSDRTLNRVERFGTLVSLGDPIEKQVIRIMDILLNLDDFHIKFVI